VISPPFVGIERARSSAMRIDPDTLARVTGGQARAEHSVAYHQAWSDYLRKKCFIQWGRVLLPAAQYEQKMSDCYETHNAEAEGHAAKVEARMKASGK
jgi:hypothetical protein